MTRAKVLVALALAGGLGSVWGRGETDEGVLADKAPHPDHPTLHRHRAPSVKRGVDSRRMMEEKRGPRPDLASGQAEALQADRRVSMGDSWEWAASGNGPFEIRCDAVLMGSSGWRVDIRVRPWGVRWEEARRVAYEGLTSHELVDVLNAELETALWREGLSSDKPDESYDPPATPWQEF